MAIDFRVYSDFCRNRKTKKLLRALGERGFYSLVYLWCTVSEQYPSGVLEDCDIDDIEIMSDWQGEAGVFVDTLVKVGFLEFNGTTYMLHDWQEKNPYVAQSENRRAAGRLNVLKRYNPALHEYYKASGRTGITEKELQEAKTGKICETSVQKSSNSLVTASNPDSNASNTTRGTIVVDSKASSPYPYPYPYPKTESNNNNIYTTATDVVVEKGGVGENKTDASASYCDGYCGGDEEQEPRLELRADNPSPSKGKVLTLTMPLSREVVEIPIKRSHVPYEDMQRLYNTVVAAENGAGNSPTRCLRLDDKRRKVLAKAWNETPYMPWFEEYARMVRDSCPFLMGKEAGRNGRFFKLDIAQFFRSDIITKALEGKYRTRYDGALTLEQVFDIWNEKLAPRGFDRAVILGTETERRDKLRTILDEFDNTVAAVGGAEKFFRALCDVATADPWCCGENKQQRKITVNFFLEPRSVARLIQTSLS